VKVSIVTPSYNQVEYLALCVASVADQQGIEIEHIVQDAGSTGDLTALRKVSQTLRLFIEPDDGMYDAINRGLRRATGDICSYLNCDEQYLPDALATVTQFFEAHPDIDVLFGDIILVDPTGHPLSYRRTVLPTKAHVRLAHLNTATCATFFRHKLLDRGFYFDPQWKVIGDAVWIDTLLCNQVKMAAIREPLSVFTFTGENLGTTGLSQFEQTKWKRGSDNWMGKRLLAVFSHRMRKALTGAYFYRDVDIQIFTLKSPDRRQRLTAESVGFMWPR
jgi:glycosyltransferase involved in cell wall biosynthesis